mmetsp:Transcript_7008/g.9921  ORF Transcript_7008/g.9921 Transcript_7008/m.9921 type:complete len:511 (+) Transcript_7008:47-1579(+)|eukprot:CAMPEP_0170074420 /NCGR_PEP_ID=MMETSP0019_2-20121128/11714_1 /TAXON_ID=98059 /ORGANISM="Dinobryon sp., Strain UTEXLB2267" /LENGTH=510 /DNA_ID=CAMNT_0010284685 /DNA_START=47 /DNA_END=1579 /DNA_ORIENTATION=-
MSIITVNPLFELIVWTIQASRKVTFELIWDLFIHAPQYYEYWWTNLLRDAPLHVFIETSLILFILWLTFIRRTVDPGKSSNNTKLTQKEVDWLLETWQPEPLVPELSTAEKFIIDNCPLIEGFTQEGDALLVRGVSEPVIDCCSFDFLGMSQDATVKKVTKDALDYYGCGSCGPRGFYGTIDQHLNFELAIAKFMGTQEAISYSDGASALSSAIPAFSKKGDLLIVDESVSEPILTGLNLSRSTVQFFKHNDVVDLRSILEAIAEDDVNKRRDSTQQRRFIVVEGLYRNEGDICPLPEILALKEEFCYRMILDESLSFGTLGASGRGVTEHFGIETSDVEIVLLAMDTALASIGGVCVGSREIVDHQRLSGAGYCFSASAPPFLSAAAIAALTKLEKEPQMLVHLNDRVQILYGALKSIPLLQHKSTLPTPVMHLVFETPLASVNDEAMAMLEIAKLCLQGGVAVTASKFAIMKGLRPSLVVCASTKLTDMQIKKIAHVIGSSVRSHLKV